MKKVLILDYLYCIISGYSNQYASMAEFFRCPKKASFAMLDWSAEVMHASEASRRQTCLPILSSFFIKHLCFSILIDMQVWRNWQTRTVQVRMRAISCRFKSCYLHQKGKDFTLVRFFPFFAILCQRTARKSQPI